MPMSLKKMKATHWFRGAAYDTATNTGVVLLDGHVYVFKGTTSPRGSSLRSVESLVEDPARRPAVAGLGNLITLNEPVRVVFKHHEDRVQSILEVVNPEIDLPIVTVGTRLVQVQVAPAGLAPARTDFVFEYDPSCLPDSVRIEGAAPQGTPQQAPVTPADDGVPAEEDEG